MKLLLAVDPSAASDLAAKEVLLDALLHYNGTLVFVAHDRYFLDRLPDEILEVGHGSAVRYLGNYEAYLRKKADATTAPPPRPTENVQSAAATVTAGNGDRAAVASDRDAAKRAAREAAKRQREVVQIEQLIAIKEEALGGVGAAINAPDFYQRHPNPQAVFSEFAKLKDEVESLYARLERLERRSATAGAPDAKREE